MRRFLVIILMIFNLTSLADEKKALRFLEKGDYEKLIETLEKDILKDSLNPGTYYWEVRLLESMREDVLGSSEQRPIILRETNK